MVRELTAGHEDDPTAKRMLDMARHVRVHATSASGYMRLKGIGRLRRDYGLTDVKETGIPEVHEHLRDIGRDAGVLPNAKTAALLLKQLRDEIAFFFKHAPKRFGPESTKLPAVSKRSLTPSAPPSKPSRTERMTSSKPTGSSFTKRLNRFLHEAFKVFRRRPTRGRPSTGRR
jgi:hypothetical protein